VHRGARGMSFSLLSYWILVKQGRNRSRLPSVRACAPYLCVFSVWAQERPPSFTAGKFFFCPSFWAGVCAVVHPVSGGVSLFGAHLQLPGAVGELQQRHLFAQPMQHLGDIGLRKPRQRTDSDCPELQRFRGACEKRKQNPAALQRVRADFEAPRSSTSQPLHPARRRPAGAAAQAAAGPAEQPGEQQQEDWAGSPAQASAPQSLSAMRSRFYISLQPILCRLRNNIF